MPPRASFSIDQFALMMELNKMGVVGGGEGVVMME
jgi:hypothetical protein